MSIDWEKPVQFKILGNWIDVTVIGINSRGHAAIQYTLPDGWTDIRIFPPNEEKLRQKPEKPEKQEFWIGFYQKENGECSLWTNNLDFFQSEDALLADWETRGSERQIKVRLLKTIPLHEYILDDTT